MGMAMISAHRPGEQPVHPRAQIAILVRPDDQMKVVGHEAPTEHAHGDLDAGVADGFHERLIVAVLEEDLAAGVAAVQDVVTLVADRGSCGAWHALSLSRHLAWGKNNQAKIILDVLAPGEAWGRRIGM